MEKVTFCTLLMGRKKLKGMEAAYRYGLDPFRKHINAQIGVGAKKVMTFYTRTYGNSDSCAVISPWIDRLCPDKR